MVAYILNRLAGLFFVFFIVSIVAFLLMHSVPGGPFDEDNMPLSPQAKANILAKYGLDQPIHIQYIKYMSMRSKVILERHLKIPTQQLPKSSDRCGQRASNSVV